MDKSVKWLYAAENSGGGIAAWNDGGRWLTSYPEVTGYLLPTMMMYAAHDLAIRSAGWLLSIQNPNGSWNGIDGAQRPFDTAAIIEGLVYMYENTGNNCYIEAAERAQRWVRTQIAPEGYLMNNPDNADPEIYNLRASAIIDNERELNYWKMYGLNHGERRTHYLAYALEGALNIDPNDAWAISQIEMAYNVQNGLMPFFVRPDWSSSHPAIDYCASAQMAILYHRVGLDVGRLYRMLRNCIDADGGIPQSNDDRRQISWAVKFWLDLKGLME